MKKLKVNKDTLLTLNGLSAEEVHGGTGRNGWYSANCPTRLCPSNVCRAGAMTTLAGPYGAALGLATNLTQYTGSRNGCATLHTCRWSGITTQPCR
jgi:hypothetical protein